MTANSKKFLWNAIDRVFFIGMGVAGTIATTYITGILKINPPELVARQTFNYVDEAPVPESVGALKLDYIKDSSAGYGVFRVDFENGGRGPANDVRMQIKFPEGVSAAYQVPPDFKVYKPRAMQLENSEFYAEMPKFPSGAADWAAFRIEGDKTLLCRTRVKFVSDDYEGEVQPVRGIDCR